MKPEQPVSLQDSAPAVLNEVNPQRGVGVSGSHVSALTVLLRGFWFCLNFLLIDVIVFHFVVSLCCCFHGDIHVVCVITSFSSL